MTLSLVTGQNAGSQIEPTPIINDAPKLHRSFTNGDVAYQGDIIFICIPRNGVDEVLRDSTLSKDNALDILDPENVEKGTSGTHVAARGTVYNVSPENRKAVARCIAGTVKKICGRKIDIEPEYIGPLYVPPTDPTENDVTHSRHGNQGFCIDTNSIIAIIYQRTVGKDGIIQRVRD